MKKSFITLTVIMLIAIMMTATVYATNDYIIPENVKSDVIETTVDEFNVIRENLALEPLVTNEILKSMAQVHSKYMDYNNTLSSIEESDFEFFRGRYPWDRATYFKYGPDYIYEFVKKDVINYQQGLEELLYDPVSRNILLDPMYTEIGMAVEGDYFSYEFGGNERTRVTYVNFPYTNQQNVRTVWHGDSFDALYKGIEILNEQVGVPITITYYGEEIKEISNLNVILMNKTKNETVPFKVLMPGDYYLLKNTLTILPLDTYDYDTHYQIQINFVRERTNGLAMPFKSMYSFTTESMSRDTIKSPYITRGEFTEKLVRNFAFPLIEPLEPKFLDVDLTKPQSIYIYTANDQGLINGLSESKFEPDLNITREQAYIIFVRAFENEHEPILVTDEDIMDTYNDSEMVSFWAEDYVIKAHELGIVMNNNGSIHPGNYLTTEDFESMLSQYNISVSALTN